MLTFLVIVAALWLRGSSLPTRGELLEGTCRRARPTRLAGPAIVCVVAVIVALFVVPFDYRFAIGVSLAGTIIGLSLVLITGYVGQVSLLQVPLAGIAAFAVSHLATDGGMSFPVVSVLAVMVATATGFFAGASALRVRGVTLAVVTLAAAIAIEQFGFANPTWGVLRYGNASPSRRSSGWTWARPPDCARSAAGCQPRTGPHAARRTTAIALLVLRVRQSGLGTRLLAVRSNESAAAAAGVSVPHTKFTAYALSSCIAGVGGVAYAYAFTKVTVDSFGILVALQFVAFAYIGGITMIPGAVFAGLMTTGGVIPHFLDAQLGLSQTWILLVAGVALILCLRLFPAGIAGSWKGARVRPRRRDAGARHRVPASSELATVVPAELGRAVVADGVARAGDVVGPGEQPQARLLQADELLELDRAHRRHRPEAAVEGRDAHPARAARSPTAKRSVWWSRIEPITPPMWVRLLSASAERADRRALLAGHEAPDDLALEHRRERLPRSRRCPRAWPRGVQPPRGHGADRRGAPPGAPRGQPREPGGRAQRRSRSSSTRRSWRARPATDAGPGSGRRAAARPASSDRPAATARRAGRRAVALVHREQRLERLRRVVDRRPRVAVALDAAGDRRDGQLVGVDVVELVPARGASRPARPAAPGPTTRRRPSCAARSGCSRRRSARPAPPSTTPR